MSEVLPRIAMIGCGAITEAFYVPAFRKQAGMNDRWVFVDPNQERAQAVARRLGSTKTAASVDEIADTIDGAIVAVPHHLHTTVATPLLLRKLPVLCEKPLAECSADATALVQLAAEQGTSLCLNHTRRLFATSRRIKKLLEERAIGDLLSIRYFDGSEFSWPTATGFYFDFRLSRRGVLQDIGAHVFDLICWWLGSMPEIIEAQTDAFGGGDAVADVSLSWKTCRIHVRLSRLARLENTIVLTGTHGSISAEVYGQHAIRITRKDGTIHVEKLVEVDTGHEIVSNFLDVVKGKAAPIVSGADALPSLRLLDQAYECAHRFSLPWYD